MALDSRFSWFKFAKFVKQVLVIIVQDLKKRKRC